MCKALVLIIATGLFGVASVAQATPTAYYDPTTGSVHLQIDRPGVAPVVLLKSVSGRLTGAPNDLTGIPEDFGDAPFVFAYFDVPQNFMGSPPDLNSLYDLGRIVEDGGPKGDLVLEYIVSFPAGNNRLTGNVVEIPEPSTIILGLVCLLTYGGLR